MRSRLDGLRGSAKNSLSANGDGARQPRTRLIRDVYTVLQSTESPDGLDADAVSQSIVQSDAKSAHNLTQSTASEAEQLEPWVDVVLRALEETGHVYRAGSDERFLVSISDQCLDEKDIGDLFCSAFSPANLWTISSAEEVRREAARQHGSGPQGESGPGMHDDDINGREPTPGRMNASLEGTLLSINPKRIALSDLTQLYTTTHEVHSKSSKATAPRSCLWDWKGGKSLHHYVGVGRECTGRLTVRSPPITVPFHLSHAPVQSSLPMAASLQLPPASRGPLTTSPSPRSTVPHPPVLYYPPPSCAGRCFAPPMERSAESYQQKHNEFEHDGPRSAPTARRVLAYEHGVQPKWRVRCVCAHRWQLCYLSRLFDRGSHAWLVGGGCFAGSACCCARRSRRAALS